MACADFLANGSDGGFDEVRGSPVAACAADIEDEILDELRAERRVVNLGMKLNGPDAALFISDGGKSIGGDCCAFESGGQLESFIAMAHPDLDGPGQAFKELDGGVFESHFSVTVLALGSSTHLAAEVVNDEVESITDAKSRQIELQESGVGSGGVSVVNGRWAAGKDNS